MQIIPSCKPAYGCGAQVERPLFIGRVPEAAVRPRHAVLEAPFPAEGHARETKPGMLSLTQAPETLEELTLEMGT